MLSDSEKIEKCRREYDEHKTHRHYGIYKTFVEGCVFSKHIIDNTVSTNTFAYKGMIIDEVHYGEGLVDSEFYQYVHSNYEKGDCYKKKRYESLYLKRRLQLDQLTTFQDIKDQILEMINNELDDHERVDQPWMIFNFFGIKVSKTCSRDTLVTFIKLYYKKYCESYQVRGGCYVIVDYRTGNEWCVLPEVLYNFY